MVRPPLSAIKGLLVGSQSGAYPGGADDELLVLRQLFDMVF